MINRLPEGSEGLHGYDDGEGDDGEEDDGEDDD